MFSYLFMKILEGRPRSYDRRMDAISRGRIGLVKQTVASEIRQGARVLEIGCGTAELASMMVSRGAAVTAFDPNPAMVEAARERVNRDGTGGRLTIKHMGVEDMDGLSSGHYDAVVSTLVLSELSEQERRFTLFQARRVLKPGGVIVIADEVIPRKALPRLIQALFRLPLLLFTYLVARNPSRPIADLPGELKSAGFSINKEVRIQGDALAVLTGSVPEKS